MDIIQHLRLPLVLCAVVGCALSAGIFYAFSTFVMQALALQPPAPGIAAMQSINITVINPWFMAAFFGPAVAGGMLTLLAWQHRALFEQPAALYWLAGTVLYVLGTIGVTVLGNIPLNDALAVVRPDSAEGMTLWTKYLSDWTFWNHVRTGAAFVAAGLFTLSLCVRTGINIS